MAKRNRTSNSINIRVPLELFEDFKGKAEGLGIGYQVLIKKLMSDFLEPIPKSNV